MNVKHLLTKHLSENQIIALSKAGFIANNLGMALYLVGGAVRDMLIDVKPKELDLVIEGDLNQFIKELEKELDVKISSTSKFMTMTTSIEDTKYDIARSRNESYVPKGSLPSVSPSNITEDILRRDFSINAICLDLSPNKFGNIIDKQNGISDLKNKIIRVIHDESFLDDPTRIFRAIRFSSRLNFSIDKYTEELMEKHISKISELSPARIFNEIKKISNESNPYNIYKTLEQKKILSVISPFLFFDATKDLVEKVRNSVKFKDPLDFWINILTQTKNPQEVKNVSLQLNLTRKMEKQLIARCDLNEIIQNWRSKKYYQHPPISRMEPIPKNTLVLEFELNDDKKIQEILSLIINNLPKCIPILTGNDLIAIGVPPGKPLGDLLYRIKEKRFLGVIVNKNDETNFVKTQFT